MRKIYEGISCGCGRPAFAKNLCKRCYNVQYRRENHDSYQELQRIWRANNPGYARDWAREKRAKCSPEQFQISLHEQEGCCAICGLPMLEEPRADHNHATGKFRGLLHNRCNLALGAFSDDIELLRKAIRYLERTNQ